MEKFAEIRQKIEDAEMVLVGIGEEYQLSQNEQENLASYEQIAKLLNGKNYFVLTVCEDNLIFQSSLEEGRIVVCKSGNQDDMEDKAWQRYTKWLGGTLNHRLCILELGAGFAYPAVLRWPFERIAMLNQKASFIRVHELFPQVEKEIADKSISVKMKAKAFLMEVS